MYSLEQVKRGLSHPNLLFREVNRLYYTRAGTADYNEEGVAIMDEDWDNLLLLDACRYDMFAEQASLTGTLSKRTSRGSNTVEFLRGNFGDGTYHDTVYVTANPQFRRFNDELDGEFHDVVDVWRDEGWDESYNTVLPSTTAEYARKARETYPDKRLLVHFIQPHYPFLSSDSTFDKQHLHQDDAETDDLWHQKFYGKLDTSRAEIWRLYRMTLDEALPHVKSLMTDLGGKTVVSADHGNMVGERARPIPLTEWGHPEGIHTPELVDVPWLEYESGERRTITEDPPKGQSEEAGDEVNERLRQLGYRT